MVVVVVVVVVAIVVIAAVGAGSVCVAARLSAPETFTRVSALLFDGRWELAHDALQRQQPQEHQKICDSA